MRLPTIIVFILLLSMAACRQAAQQQFTDVSANSGITFANNISETEAQNIFTYEYMYNGAGVAVGDVNNDGLADVFFSANQQPDQLYLNKGNLTFSDATTAAGIAGKSGWKTGVSMADVNGDGWLDIYVCYSGNGAPESRGNQLFINKGNRNGVPFFEEEAARYGLDAPGTNSTQAVFFDYDNDGDLDMFLLNHAVVFYSPLVNTYKLRHKRHPWYSNYLYRNDGGHFTDVSAEAGIAGGGNNFGLGVVAADINNDGWQDLYMTNDYEEQDFLLLNNGNGSFREITKEALQHISKYGMGCDVADYNNDGLLDIMVPDMWPEDNYRQKVLRGGDEFDKYNLLADSGYMHQNMRNTLQLNRGWDRNGIPQFSEIGQLAGVSHTDWSWSSLLADLDDDGYKDLFVTNGFWRDYSNMDFQTYRVAEFMAQNGRNAPIYQLIDSIPQTRLSNYAFRNTGNLQFDNVTNNWGLHTANVSHGTAYADLDNDGDLDLIVNNMGERASVFRNNNIARAHYLNIVLRGDGGNTNAVGSRISISHNGQEQVAELQPVRGYLSSMQPMVHFGVGKDTLIATLTVRWAGGGITTLHNISANETITIDKAGATTDRSPSQEVLGKPLFTDVTAQSGLNFIQTENRFVDFKQESLLPWQLSKQGPKMATADVNGDGLEDLFIGAPKGKSAALYLQQSSGRFTASASQPWIADSACEDIQPAFFDADGDGDADLYVVSGGNENTIASALQDRLYINNGKGLFAKSVTALPPMTTSKSCVAVADFNGDGKPDLFVGGRLVAGKYGIAPTSYLLQNETTNGKIQFRDVTASVSPALQHAGMITCAVWRDVNNDRLPDLLVAGEWMPVMLFLNERNKLTDRTAAFGLQQSNGLWTCMLPMDIDGDGDEDFLLGNLAPNTQLAASVQQPMTLAVNDFMQTGSTQCILSYYIDGKSYPYASRDELLSDLPALKKKFLYYKDYATATLTDIFTPEQRAGMQTLRVYQLRNCWLEQAGNQQFILHELPVAAQFSPVQGAVLTDVNNDGKQEIFAAGNFYPFRVQLGREDAGKGMLLRWDAGKKEVVASPLGIAACGDVRDVVQVVTDKGMPRIILSKNDAPAQVLAPLLVPEKR